jgi:hypothetical protein
LYMVGAELAIASICLLKAEHLEKSPDAMKPNTQKSIVDYLNLGLEHLKFTPEDSATNETFLFSSLHEKLLRAKLLIKTSEYSESYKVSELSNESSSFHIQKQIVLHEAYENVRLCLTVASEYKFHAILYQAGALMKLLGKAGFSIEEKEHIDEHKNSDVRLDTPLVDVCCRENGNVFAIQGALLQDKAFGALVASNGSDAFSLFVC